MIHTKTTEVKDVSEKEIFLSKMFDDCLFSRRPLHASCYFNQKDKKIISSLQEDVNSYRYFKADLKPNGRIFTFLNSLSTISSKNMANQVVEAVRFQLCRIATLC